MKSQVKKAVSNTTSSPISTIAGLVIAGATAAQTFAGTAGFDLKTDWMQLTIAVVIAVFGCIMKDKKGAK